MVTVVTVSMPFYESGAAVLSQSSKDVAARVLKMEI